MSIETEHLNASEGWTLQEALRRTTDPGAWDVWTASKAAFKKFGTAELSPATSSAAVVTNQPDPVADGYNRIILALRDLLSSGALVATGLRRGRGAASAIIPSEDWRALELVDPERSIVRETTKRKDEIYDVRVFPPVYIAGLSVAHWPECSMVDVFRRCVIGDPEVVACSKRLPKQYFDETIFNDGRFPGIIVEYLWPLKLTAETLAFDFVRTGVMFTDVPSPPIPHEVSHVSEVIVDRWHELRQRLIKGDLVARGLHVRTGELQYIDRMQWARQGGSVDVENGDLVEFENNEPAIRWSGLSVLSAQPTLVSVAKAAAGPLGGKRTSRNRRRPVADAVAQGLKANKLDQSPGKYSLKEIASIIAPGMPKPPKTEAEMLALAKAVKRFYEEIDP